MNLKTALALAAIGKIVVLLWELWLLRNPEDAVYSAWILMFDSLCLFIFFFVFYLKVREGKENE